MCGRVYIAPANPELRELIKDMNRSVLAGRFMKEKEDSLSAQGEICPSAILPVIALNRAGEKRVYPMKWGFSVRGKLLINARSETASEKRMFREAWYSHRCVIPVSAYFEWEHDEKNRPGQKYTLRPKRTGLIRLAGLYHMENSIPAFVILTRPAADNLTWMHDRMPVMLPEDAAEEWIKPDYDPFEIIQCCITDVAWQPAG